MKRITATVKELVAEVIGDGNMFDKARQEKAIAGGGAPLPKSNMKNEVQDGGRTGIGLNSSPHAEPEPAGQGMIPPPSLRPMKDFNPAEPAVLHDAVNDASSPGIGNVRTTSGRTQSTMLRGGSHGTVTYLMDGAMSLAADRQKQRPWSPRASPQAQAHS
jgi:hypothetical protein